MRCANITSWVVVCILGALGFAIPAGAQTSPAPYTTVSLYFPGALLAGTISPAPSGQSNFPATRYTYDGNERLSRVETGYLSGWPGSGLPSGWGSLFCVRKMVAYSYDANGRKVAETATGYANCVASGVTNATQYSYDGLDRLTCTAVRMNPSAPLPASACTLETPGANGPDRITENYYDALNRLTQVQKAVGTSNQENYASYTYTLDSLQQDITDADGNVTQLAYDGFDRLATWYFPSKTTVGAVDTSDYEAYGYDPNGNRTSLRKRDTSTISYQYDGLNRMTVKQVPIASQDVSYGYDLRGLMTSAEFSSSGLGIANTYDGFGRLIQTVNNMSGVSRAVDQGFDYDGDRISVTFPADANYFDYDYDGLDRLKDVRENGTTTIVSESYDPVMLSAETRGAVTSSYGYDSAERPQSWVDTFPGSGPNVTITLAYNAADQIVTRTRDNDAYNYTAYKDGTTAYSANGLNQYTTVGGSSVGYDPNGNLTSDGSTSTTYTYDVENRLTSVSGSSYSATLIYDPLGRLFEVATGSGNRQFLYDGDQLVAEYNGVSGAMLRRYVPGPGGDDPLIWYEGSAVSSANRRSLQADYKGSIQSVADASGNELGINRYDEYGVPATGNLGTFQYTGQAWLSEVGLYYYKARMYSPRLGRFMQTDPIGYTDDLDLYAYVGNDPLDRDDPTGMCAEDLCATEGGAALLGAAAYYGTAVLVAAGLCPETCGAIHSWIGSKAAAVWHHIVHNESKPSEAPVEKPSSPTQDKPGERSRSNPFTGEPGSVSETTTRDGQPKQTREYGEDGYPTRDVDHDHDHGQGQPHVHDWTRPSDGSPPSHQDRQPGRAPEQGEVEGLRNRCIKQSTLNSGGC